MQLIPVFIYAAKEAIRSTYHKSLCHMHYYIRRPLDFWCRVAFKR